MSITEGDVAALFDPDTVRGEGPVTRARLSRTAVTYVCICALGLAPLVLGMAPGWQAAGLGLWLPGAGFVADGGWWLLLFPVTLVCFAFSIVAWFWAGAVVAPVIVWLGSALLAGAVADRPASLWSYLFVAACMIAIGVVAVRHRRRRRETGRERLAARRSFLPASISEVREQVARAPGAARRSMTEEQLASLRYVLDRSLQPVDEFNGFTIIDQFQPAALRYQLNHMGFALGIAQGAYTPNFTGYLRQAQRNLIAKYLMRRVWGYWVYESCWGHLNFFNFDPADKDNIMLTGWFGMHVGQYMLNSGDRRYAEPASLTFRLNNKTAYEHDFHSIIESVSRNFDESAFCLFPCEPNWIYPICNHYGMVSLAVHDALFNTTYVDRHLPRWLNMLDTEFTDPSGSIVGLRSKHTGIEFPFPVGEAGYAHFANCFSPERGQRLWAIARKEIEPLIRTDEDGRAVLKFPGKGLDAGHYGPGFTHAYAAMLVAAREFGDTRIADAALNGLEADCGVSREGGICRYTTGSNIANATAVMGKLMDTGDFRRSFVEGPDEKTLSGPILEQADYPDVLVARAFSHGDDLDLVLYPGHAGVSAKRLGLAQLHPSVFYRVAGADVQGVRADDEGRAMLDVTLRGETRVRLEPMTNAE